MSVDIASQDTQAELVELRRRVAELEQQAATQQANGHALAQHQLAAIESALDGIAILDQQGTYVYMNQAHARIHGYDQPADLLGKSWKTVVPEEMLAVYEQEYMPLLFQHGHWRGEAPSKRRDGSVYPTDIALHVLEDGGLVCILRDITEQKQFEQTIQRSQLMLQIVIDHMPHAIYWKDLDLTYMGGNRNFAREAGLASTRDVAGKSDHNMPWAADAQAHRDDDREIIAINSARLRREESYEFPDGTHWIRTSKIPLRDDQGHVFALLGMFEDVTEQKRGEAERAQLQEEIIRAQAAALAELSTPLIPINEQVMVMPLVGSMDSRRAQQVLDTLLNGIATSRVSSVILDITGVPVVDTQVANALLRAAQAVKLLGARVVLTGIRPEVAQTLVSLGTDLSGITTRSSLQSGIAYAAGM
jgi:rsbT co-antagonist protein RsbR